MSLMDDPFADMVKYDGACQICHGDMRKCDGHCGDAFYDILAKVREKKMTVRAKFQCQAKGQYEVTLWDEEHKTTQGVGMAYRYEFYAVTGGSDENNRFFASTPGGNVFLYAIRDDLFTPGKSYYLDFTEAES